MHPACSRHAPVCDGRRCAHSLRCAPVASVSQWRSWVVTGTLLGLLSGCAGLGETMPPDHRSPEAAELPESERAVLRDEYVTEIYKLPEGDYAYRCFSFVDSGAWRWRCNEESRGHGKVDLPSRSTGFHLSPGTYRITLTGDIPMVATLEAGQ